MFKLANTIAILGGTFDPIHNGHIHIANNIATWLNLTQVRLMPAHIPPHKSTTHVSANDRAAMVKLVCAQNPLFYFDDRELKRHQPSYTVETLRAIKSEQQEHNILFIIGMDSLLSFTQWHQWQNILKLCHLVVSTRPGFTLQQMPTKVSNELARYFTKEPAELGNSSAGRILLVEQSDIDISSTALRAKIMAGENYQSFIPAQVYNYIQQHQLYQR